MATVRVGTRRIVRGTGFEEEHVGKPGIEVTQQWLELNGVRIDGHALGLVSVHYKGGGGEGVITIELACEGFTTADHREPASAELNLPGTDGAPSDAALVKMPDGG